MTTTTLPPRRARARQPLVVRLLGGRGHLTASRPTPVLAFAAALTVGALALGSLILIPAVWLVAGYVLALGWAARVHASGRPVPLAAKVLVWVLLATVLVLAAAIVVAALVDPDLIA